ncbi:stage VI sporulation protein F [Aneurinibacillus terranovensis]|uniref:stage VI sporulation protein F n=1 Tax=Aneurinibacillus terranovensis TaxID=278991 RepID=UPI00040DF662|nr:stage VI sporulation protein F [Aneurinibacillus terranovensis]
MAKIPKILLDKLQGKNFDMSLLESLAGSVKKEDFADEEKVRNLVRQLAVMAGVALDQDKEDRIIDYINNQGLQNGDLSTLSNLLKM